MLAFKPQDTLQPAGEGGDAGVEPSRFYSCASGFFKQPCKNFQGTLWTVFLAGTGARQGPQMATYLEYLNLVRVTDVGGLTVVAGDALGPIGSDLAPAFLPDLARVNGDLSIQDMSRNKGGQPCLRSLPGLTHVGQVGGSLVINGTAFVDMASFSGLTSVGGNVTLVGNAGLVSLRGLEGLVAVGGRSLGAGPVFDTGRNNALALPGAIAPLSRAAGCREPPSLGSSQRVSISLSGCRDTLSSWPSVCSAIASGAC